ncbi:ArnT family glycosyltransferase [Hymenobacter sp. B81]|uniref:ArnT family glycosyltransferase n=1 Tax=Hymenobacter sp. B81 TaxID=3344878 RepID=UPI0037DC3FF0
MHFSFLSAHKWLLLWLLLLAAVLLLNLGGWGVLETSEARYAEIGREMLAGGDWWHPRLLGIQHYHKPPLTYWLTAAGLAVFGHGAAAVRVLPVLALLGQVALVYGLGLLYFGPDRRRALAAAVVYGSLPVVLAAALNVTTDGYLITLELLATYAFVRYHHTPREKPAAPWLYLGWLALGLGLLTKGPVTLVLPLLAVLSLHLTPTAPRRPWSPHHLLAGGVFGLTGLSWYLALLAENPAFRDYFLFKHLVDRYANALAFKRDKPWWYYLVLVPLGSLPWSGPLLVELGRTGWRGLGRRWQMVLLCWVLLPLLFFSFSSSKLLFYVLPVFPGVALLTVELLGRRTDAVLLRWYVGFVALFGLVLGGLCLLPVFGPAYGLEVRPATLAWPATGLVVIILTHIFWDEVRIAPRLLLLTALYTAALVLGLKAVLRQAEPAVGSLRPVAQRLRELGLDRRPVLVYDEMLPSLAFELQRLPVTLNAGDDNLRRETQFEHDDQWRRYWVNLNDPADTLVLGPLLRQRPVILVKDQLPTDRQWLVQGLMQHEHLGRWRIYYTGW